MFAWCSLCCWWYHMKSLEHKCSGKWSKSHFNQCPLLAGSQTPRTFWKAACAPFIASLWRSPHSIPVLQQALRWLPVSFLGNIFVISFISSALWRSHNNVKIWLYGTFWQVISEMFSKKPHSELVQDLSWCCQATSHNRSSCWPSFTMWSHQGVMSYGIMIGM